MPHGFDPNPSNVAVPQLVQLHAQLGARLQANRKERAALAADMRHVEAVLRLFDPTYDVRRIAVKRRNARNPHFRRGTVFRAVLDVLRTAGAPMMVAEICRRLLADKGIAEPSAKQVRDLGGAVRASLENHAGKSVVTDGEGAPRRWVIS
jgi:hypothetical protein